MEILIDGACGFEPQERTDNAFSLIAQIFDFLREKGRGVLSVSINGVVISPEELIAQIREKPVSEIDRLEITSADMRALVDEALQELQEATTQLPDLCHQLAEIFQGENPEQAYEPFQRLAEIWGAVKTRQMQVAQAMALDIETAELRGTRFDEHHQALNQILEEAAQALQSGDCVLLGDLLEYELAPRAELEDEIVKWLKSRIET